MADCKVNYSPINYLTQEPVSVWNGQSSEQYRGNITWSFATTGAPIPDGGTYMADKFQWLHSSYEKTITVGTAVLGIDDRAIDYNNVQYKFSLTAGTYKLIFEAIDPTGTWYSDRLARYPSSSGYYGTPQYALHSSSGAVLSTINFDRTKYQGQTFVHEEHEFTLDTDRTIGLYFRGMGHADSTINGFMPRFMIVPTDTKTKKFDVTSNNVTYSGYSCWSGLYHSLRKLTTATADIEPTIYTDGTAITSYTIKGNTVQNGTPTPANPVAVNGVGVRTENLFKGETNLLTNNDGTVSASVDVISSVIDVTDYDWISLNIDLDLLNNRLFRIGRSTQPIVAGSTATRSIQQNGTVDVRNYNYLLVSCSYSGVSSSSPEKIMQSMMANAGSTALPYEPYGFKIPISTLQGSAVNYLGSVQTTRQIYKFVLTGNETYTYDSAYTRFNFLANDLKFEGIRLTPLLCTHYEVVDDGRSIGNVPNNAIYAGGSVSIPSLYIKTDAYTTETDFKAYLAQQYAAGTPVTIWYILETPTTGTVNEPLMKIGNYADTLSNAAQIPTTEGANSITVDTTVQPSEFSATWSGWHNAYVKEKSENLFDESTIQVGGLDYLTGAEVTNENRRRSGFIEVNSDTYYSISRQLAQTSPSNFWVLGYDENKNPITDGIFSSSPCTIVAMGGDVSTASFWCTQTTKYIRWYVTANNSYSNLMLNSGQTALPYAPYWE